MLNTVKISVGSLSNLGLFMLSKYLKDNVLMSADLESCRLIGRILKEARIRVFVSRSLSLLHLKTLFEEMDDDHNGYLDEQVPLVRVSGLT